MTVAAVCTTLAVAMTVMSTQGSVNGDVCVNRVLTCVCQWTHIATLCGQHCTLRFKLRIHMYGLEPVEASSHLTIATYHKMLQPNAWGYYTLSTLTTIPQVIRKAVYHRISTLVYTHTHKVNALTVCLESNPVYAIPPPRQAQS